MRRLILILCALVVSCVAMAEGRIVISGGRTIELPEGCRQAVVVEHESGCNATVYWLKVDVDQVLCDNAVRGVVGYRGIAAAGAKREGDGKTPTGVFALRRGLCYVDDLTTAFPMEQYDAQYIWDENPESATYNTLLRTPKPDVKGDRLWERRNNQYRYIVVVEYNTDPIVKGAGSAIFIHAWRSEGKPTAGCVGMAESDMKALVEWLNPQLMPHIVVMPEAAKLEMKDIKLKDN